MHMHMIECDADIFARFLCSFGPPSRALVAYHLEIDDIPLRGAVGVNYRKCATTDIKAQVPCIRVEG